MTSNYFFVVCEQLMNELDTASNDIGRNVFTVLVINE
jgi:hypothetical protein